MALFGNKKKKIEELEARNAALTASMTPEMRDAVHAREELAKLHEQIDQSKKLVQDGQNILASLNSQIDEKKKQLVTFDDEILVQEFGLYQPRFDFASSSQFQDRLKEIRSYENEEVKRFNETLKNSNWTVNNSLREGRKMTGDIGRLLMRAYNDECDEIIGKIKYANIQKSLEKILKSAEQINKFGRVIGISIPKLYIDLKTEEAQLAFEYAQQKEKEKEKLRELREQEREEKKLQKEIAAKRKKLEKEKKQYLGEYQDVLKRIETATDEERAALQEKADELKANLDDVDAAVKDVDYREANSKAGYVYVISNIGSFGKDIYKIGMTRRLDPMDRIRELSDASVPFNFDVHALIFSDDAPALEAALHREFENRKLNLVNQRREFFHVTLDEIEKVVKANYDKTVDFTVTPDAEQWRVSNKMREQGIYQE